MRLNAAQARAVSGLSVNFQIATYFIYEYCTKIILETSVCCIVWRFDRKIIIMLSPCKLTRLNTISRIEPSVIIR